MKDPIHALKEFTESGESVSFKRQFQQSVICVKKEVPGVVEHVPGRADPAAVVAGLQALPAAPQTGTVFTWPGNLWFLTDESVERRMIMSTGMPMSMLLGEKTKRLTPAGAVGL